MGIAAAERVESGIWRIRLGEPEELTPVRFRTAEPMSEALSALPGCELPFTEESINFRTSRRGCVLELPLVPGEQIYGFGLNLRAFNCTDTRKTIRVSDDQTGDAGDSHAPAPFYVSNKGYAVFVDTARYANFYCGNLSKAVSAGSTNNGSAAAAASTEELYKPRELASKMMVVDVPVAQGVDLYVFGGPAMQQAIQRYILFSGGGVLPPLWGLGVFYRAYTKSTADDVTSIAEDLRQNGIPCDVMGLEPGWQSAAYSCSFSWGKERWPDTQGFIDHMRGMGYQLNLWEHAFTHPSSPLFEPLKDHSGDHLVWGGLVPDFADAGARDTFCQYHQEQFVNNGISGFKLDECDNQPLSARPWSFPELSQFGSGLDGEQMHSLFGLLYQQVMNASLRKSNVRTYSKVRASHVLASPLPFALYSDAYNHRDFVRGILTSGFSGVLWSPEVRESESVEELYRRLQSSVLSAQTVINAWYLKSPPWRQIETEKNCNGEYMPGWEEVEQRCRRILQLRMRLIPYLYSSFAEYRYKGIPPFRALVVDYPDDPQTYNLDNEYLIGNSLLAAPVFAGETARTVYLPACGWYDFWTHSKYEGGREYEISVDQEHVPLFVRAGTILPLAEPLEYVGPDSVFDVACLVFGMSPSPTTLYDDDGVSLDYENGLQNAITLSWTPESGGSIASQGGFSGKSRYRVVDWKTIG
ncbi:MAG: TIM-barrel domain-containing protein [Armatimonadota bacterium]|nr:DUF5110 domain-containing protein [bacterium]